MENAQFCQALRVLTAVLRYQRVHDIPRMGHLIGASEDLRSSLGVQWFEGSMLWVFVLLMFR